MKNMMAVRLCACTALLLAVSGQDMPPLIRGPESDTPVMTNGSATLYCTVNSGLTPEWHTGSPFSSLALDSVSSDEHYAVNESQGSLSVNGFRNKHHGGEYTCKVQSMPLTQVLLSCPGELSHAKIGHEFLTKPSNSVAPVGTMAMLKCSPPYSNPPASIVWFKDLFSFPDVLSTIVADSGNLYFLNITEEDKGHYQCWASNPVTNRVRHSNKAYLDVKVTDLTALTPQFIVTPTNKTAKLGETVEFECAVNVGPQVQWEWMGHPALPLSIVKKNGALLLIQVGEEQNGGVFRCRAGEMAAEAHLSVVAPPTIILSTDALSGAPGSRVNLTCASLSPPVSGEVHVVWQIGGFVLKSEVVSGPSYLKYILPSEGVTWIQCLMRNQYGCAQQAVSLAVIIPEPVTPSPTSPPISAVSIVVSPDVILSSGATQELSCEVSVPSWAIVFNLEWKDSSFSSLAFTTSTHLVTTVSTPGTYTCTAFVVVDSDVQLYTANVIVSADQPDSITSTQPPPISSVVNPSLSTGATQAVSSSKDVSSLAPHTSSNAPHLPSLVHVSSSDIVPATTTSFANKGSPTPSSDPGPLITSVYPSGGINELEGTDISVSCSAKHSNFILWSHTDNPKLLNQSTVTNLMSGEEYISIIALGPLLPKHQGTLTCTALDLNGKSDHRDISINVKEPVTPSPTSPPISAVSIVVSPDVILSSGATQELSCGVNIPSWASVFSLEWTDSSFSSLAFTASTHLVTTVSTPGTYTCTAIVAIGIEVQLYTANVIVSQPLSISSVVNPSLSTGATQAVSNSKDVSSLVPHTSSNAPRLVHVSSSVPATTTSSAAVTFANKGSPTPSSDPGPLITSVYPSGDINELEGTNVSVSCSAKHSNFILWSHTDNPELLTQSTVTNLMFGEEYISIIALGPLLPKHQGTLTCTALDLNGKSDHRDISINVKAVPPSHSPGTVFALWINDTSLQVIWTVPHSEQFPLTLLGYKLTWSLMNTPLPQVALRAVPFGTNQYILNGLSRTRNYQVSVWAYSKGGDGPFILAKTNDKESVTTPLPSPSSPTNATEKATEPPSPTIALFTLKSCVRLLHTVGSVTLEVAMSQNVDHYLINYTCPEAQSHNSRVINSASPVPIILTHLIPGCEYQVTAAAVDEDGTTITKTSCQLTTMNEEVPVDFNVVWSSPNDMSITWKLPSSLQSYKNVIVEMNIDGVWTPLENGQQSFQSFDPHEEHTLEVRVRIGSLVIYSKTIVVPAQLFPSLQQSPELVEENVSFMGTPWVSYGVGLTSVLLSVLAALSLILVLKHIQNKRRERNKATNHRHKRMSQSSQKALFSREDSIQSVKKPHSSSVGVNNIYTYT